MLTKTRHNKKRNTAFIYESLIRELTKSIVSKNTDKRAVIVSIIKEYFAHGSILRKQLELYKALYETTSLEPGMGEKLIYEVKKEHAALDQDQIFKEQTGLINKINKNLSKKIFSNFVPNYKNLATISQILNAEVSIKHRVLLENKLAKALSNESDKKTTMKPVDNLVYRTFVDKFNEQYKDELLEEQKDLLSRYIASIHDDGIELRLFLNEELARLKKSLNEGLLNEEINSNEQFLDKAKKLLTIMENYKKTPINTGMIEQILKVQALAKEFSDNDSKG
tara:strand:+ start:1442 stop:2281 length:840 start_codon:yes stop_codon:yes gene_type:complete